MGKYDAEYTRYYNSISNKSKNTNTYGCMYNNYNKKKNIIKECGEYCIFQCIVTFIILVTVLAMKYSNDTKSVDAFNGFKDNISEKSSYTEIIDDVKSLEYSDIRDSAIKCLSWIREVISEQQEY